MKKSKSGIHKVNEQLESYKLSNELKYNIEACYWPECDKTWHLITFKDNNETFQIPNIIVDYGVKFHKVLPKYDIPTYTNSTYDPKSNRIYMSLISNGNPYGLVENNKNVKINLK